MFPPVARGARVGGWANRVLQHEREPVIDVARTTIEVLLGPADAVRSRVLQVVGSRAAAFYRERPRRVAWLGVTGIGLSLLLTTLAPLWCLALSPVLLGVPHLVSDVRYLVVRPGLHRQRWLMVLAGAPLLLTSFGFGPAVGLLAMVPMIFSSARSGARRVVLICAWLVLTVAALCADLAFQLIFLHAHNAIAVLIWWLWRPRTDRRAWWIPAAVVLGVTAILLGLTDPLVGVCHGWVSQASGTSFEEFIERTTPLHNQTMALRLVLVFAFLQSVHYVVWLRLIPEDDRPRAAPRRFTASAMVLLSELGAPAVGVISLLALGIACWGLFDLSQARLGYLKLAAFHGYLELAVLARWLAAPSR